MKMNQASKKYMFYMTRYAAQDKGVDPKDRNTSLHNLLVKIAFNVYNMFLESFVPLFDGQRLQDF
jgi:hypothetical protein